MAEPELDFESIMPHISAYVKKKTGGEKVVVFEERGSERNE